MRKRGIHDSKADFWAHLFPLESMVYWYRVKSMREWIEERQLRLRDGRSKDGTVTGRGYLVARAAPFVCCAPVPPQMIAAYDWARGTDREIGLVWGEKVVRWLFDTGVIRPVVWRVNEMTTKAQQLAFGDFALEFNPNLFFEVKTETVFSENLYVQSHESGHNVHLVKDGSERYVAVDRLTDP